ncbi:hypothetical protein GX586_04420, partial [bacterium]|nr:hypothetical protein [bacterium]
FPAAAVIYRCGLVKQGPVAIHEQLCLSNLYDLQGAGMSQDLGLDSVRQKEVPEGMETSTAGTLDQLAFCVGRVIRSISDAPPRTDVLKEMPKLIDRANRIVRSATGELTMDYGRGVLTVTAPAAQGVAGFIGAAGALDCGDIVIASSNEYATVVAVSLDGKPLKTSAKILVQAMTEENNHGWETAALPATADVPAQSATGAQKKNTAVPGMKKIASVGGPPLVVRDILATVTFKRPDAATLAVTPLDVNGCAMKTPVACTRGANGSVTVTLLPDCLYYMVTAGR